MTSLETRISTALLLSLALCQAGCAQQMASSWMPLQAAHIKDPVLIPAAGQSVAGMETRYIVKLRDGEVEALTRLFFRDQAAARASFDDWATDNPPFDGMDLVFCTYSGEMVVGRALTPEEARRPAAARDAILGAIRQHPDVSYADPDYITQVEKERGQ